MVNTEVKAKVEMQQILHDEGGVTTVAFVSWRLAMAQNIGHGETGGILPADNHRFAPSAGGAPTYDDGRRRGRPP